MNKVTLKVANNYGIIKTGIIFIYISIKIEMLSDS